MINGNYSSKDTFRLGQGTNCCEYPDGVSQIGRWHNVPNGNGWIVVETDNQEALTSWIMGWSGQCKFPTVTPVIGNDDGRKLIKTML